MTPILSQNVESSESFALNSSVKLFLRSSPCPEFIVNQHGALHLSLIQITPQFVSATLDMQ